MKFKHSVFFTCFVLPQWLFAQEHSLSLAACLDSALAQSYRFRAVAAQVQAARAAQDAGRARYFPHLSAELTHNQLFFPPYNYRQQFGTAILDWSAGDWLKKTARAAAKEVEARQADRGQVRLEIGNRIAVLYISLLRNRQELALLAERRRILNEHLQVAEALWRAGVRTQLDVLQTRAAINSLEEQELALHADTASLQTTLAQLLGLPATSALRLQDFPDTVVSFQPDSGHAKLLQNPALLSLQRQAEAQQLKIRQVQAENLPHVQISGGYVADADPTAEGNYWQAGIGVRVPLFRWGETKFRQQEIDAQVQALHWQKAQLQREVKIQQAQIALELDGLHETYRLQQERLQITQQTLQIATANYQAGLITNLEYLDAQEEALTAQVALSETRLVYVLRVVESYMLMNEMGKIRLLQGE